LSYPASIAARTDFFARISSRIRSKIRTFESTAIPIARMIPAIPGRVRVAEKAAIPERRKRMLKTRAKSATNPANL